MQWSTTVIDYIVSIIRNNDEKFYPQQQKIITFQISVITFF